MTLDQSERTDPLEVTGRQLVAAAQRRRSARVRRRVAAVAIAGCAGLAATSAALAVTGNDSGIGAIDRWLDFADQHPPEKTQPTDTSQNPVFSFRPAPKTASPPFDIPAASGSVVGLGYQNSGGDICLVLADRDDAESPPAGSGTCVNHRILSNALDHDAARVVSEAGTRSAPTNEPAGFIQGFTRGDVDNVDIEVPGVGQAQAQLSAPWTPGTWHGGDIKAFVAVMEGLPQSPTAPLPSPVLRLTLSDGRTVSVGQ